jgi:hypothetical protein
VSAEGAEREPVAWRVHVDSPPDFTRSERVLAKVNDALAPDARVSGPVASLNQTTGVLSVTVAIEDPRQAFAYEQASAATYDALRVAGFDVDRPGWQPLLESAPLFEVDD